jgi:hypothetical protein
MVNIDLNDFYHQVYFMLDQIAFNLREYVLYRIKITFHNMKCDQTSLPQGKVFLGKLKI